MKPNTNFAASHLDVFQYASNWKKYFSSKIAAYAKGYGVEVGAGIGSTTPYLINEHITRFLCIEPDPQLSIKIKNVHLPAFCTVFTGQLSAAAVTNADIIFYIDVIEHIEDDIAELQVASNALSSGGYLCILVPANPSDYSPFDKAIGHYRRYNKKMLKKILPETLIVIKCSYLDSVGSLISKFNKWFLKQSCPGKKQILFWDRVIIPISKIADKLIRYSAGKSIVLIAQKK